MKKNNLIASFVLVSLIQMSDAMDTKETASGTITKIDRAVPSRHEKAEAAPQKPIDGKAVRLAQLPGGPVMQRSVSIGDLNDRWLICLAAAAERSTPWFRSIAPSPFKPIYTDFPGEGYVPPSPRPRA